MTQSTLEITEVRADDPAAIGAAFEIARDSLRADLPDMPDDCRYEHDMQFVVPPPRRDRHVFLALHADGPVAVAHLDLPREDNLDKAHIDVQVRPEFRRQGAGRALYAHASAVARADGRTGVLGFSRLAAAPSGFAGAAGLSNGLLDARRRLRLADLDEDAIERMYAEGRARSAGYALVEWGTMPPEEYIEDLAALDSSFLTETPMGELEYEPEVVDAAEHRQLHEAFAQWGSRRYQAGLVHEASGRMVAWTAIKVARTVDWHGWQLITLVHPAHRGHRLGVVAKVANLRTMRAAEPAVTTIDTFNAADNSYMIAINEAMGFRLVDHWANWQGPLAS